MKDKLKKEMLFPVDKNEQDSMKNLADKLEKLNAKNKNSQPIETISDDFDVDAEKLKMIERSENEMRQILQLVDIDYDALIRMDGKSVYSRAVSANANVLNYVKNAENPVLEAVKISLQFKPYAEFMEKYGQEPKDIFQNIKQEIEGHKKGDDMTVETEAAQAVEGSSFSSSPNVKTKESKRSNVPTLAQIFNQ